MKRFLNNILNRNNPNDFCISNVWKKYTPEYKPKHLKITVINSEDYYSCKTDLLTSWTNKGTFTETECDIFNIKHNAGSNNEITLVLDETAPAWFIKEVT